MCKGNRFLKRPEFTTSEGEEGCCAQCASGRAIFKTEFPALYSILENLFLKVNSNEDLNKIHKANWLNLRSRTKLLCGYLIGPGFERHCEENSSEMCRCMNYAVTSTSDPAVARECVHEDAHNEDCCPSCAEQFWLQEDLNRVVQLLEDLTDAYVGVDDDKRQ
jgi:hypothetical protein